MSDTNLTTPTDVADVEDDYGTSAALDRTADRILSEGGTSVRFADAGPEDRAFAPTASVRQAIREDLGKGRAVAAERTSQARDAIRDQPLKTAAYAVGVGVIIGLLLRR